MQFAYHVSCNAHAIYINLQHEITFIIPVLRSVMHLWTGLMLLEKPLRTDFEGEKERSPDGFLFELRQIAGHLPSTKKGLFWLSGRFTHPQQSRLKKGTPREFGLFSKTPLRKGTSKAASENLRKMKRGGRGLPAEMPQSPSWLSALLFSESARSFADFPLCFEKRPLSLSLLLFWSSPLHYEMRLPLFAEPKNGLRLWSVWDKRPLALWGLSFYEFAFASRTLKPKEGTAPPFIP